MAYRGRYRRRRRAPVVWHVNQGYSSADVLGTPNFLKGGAFSSNLGYYSAGVAGAGVTSIYRLVEDYPATAIAQTLQTGDDKLRGGGYFLKRIVGKLFVTAIQGAGQTPPVILVGAGLVVLTSDDVTGAPTMASTPNYYNPNLKDNERAPWIWRRDWLLGNLNSGVTISDWYYAPQTNMEYGSVMDGPHVDAITKRALGPRESLGLVFSVNNPQDIVFSSPSGGANFVFTYRVLVTPTTAPMSNRRNSSF